MRFSDGYKKATYQGYLLLVIVLKTLALGLLGTSMHQNSKKNKEIYSLKTKKKQSIVSESMNA